jgi:hypothetical protein
MNTWWSAIDTEHTSYDELKHRRVIAQGWKDLGDISALTRLIPSSREAFTQIIQLLGDNAYPGMDWWENQDRTAERAPTVMWNLLSVQEGDLVVGIEGTTVRGICRAGSDGADSYTYQAAWEYAQTVDFPATWHDWDESVMGSPPQSPSRSVLGLRGLSAGHDDVANAWQRLGL